jgi:ATP-dependent RNA helicase SUPV3L1/SUV3
LLQKAATEALTPQSPVSASSMQELGFAPPPPSPVVAGSDGPEIDRPPESKLPPGEAAGGETPAPEPSTDILADGALATCGEMIEPPVEPVPTPSEIESATAADGSGATEFEKSDTAAVVLDEALVEAAEPPPPVLIEVWRPHRQANHARRPQPGRSEPRERSAPPTADLAGASDAAKPAHRHEKRQMQPNGRGRGPELHVESRDESAGRPSHGASRPGGEDGMRHSGRAQTPRMRSKPRFEGQRERRDGGANWSESERRHASGGGETKSFERAPDLNSPFAKLLALKASLEEKNKQES